MYIYLYIYKNIIHILAHSHQHVIESSLTVHSDHFEV